MIDVACAIIRNEDDRVLLVQRGEIADHPLRWEFPGGKIKKGESGEECIIREIREELSMDIIICRRLESVVHDYGNKQVNLIPFVCDTLDELPFLSEHNDYRWLDAEEILIADLLDADILVARQYLKDESKVPDKQSSDLVEADLTPAEEGDLMDLLANMMSRKEAEFFAASALENKAILHRLLHYSVGSEGKLAFRASWTLSKVFDRYPELIYPHINFIVNSLGKLENESTERSFLRILSLADLPRVDPGYHGVLADHCFSALKSGFSAVAVKSYSMEILYKLALIYPGLIYELCSSINMLQGESQAGIVARGRIILKKLANISSDLLSSQQ